MSCGREELKPHPSYTLDLPLTIIHEYKLEHEYKYSQKKNSLVHTA